MKIGSLCCGIGGIDLAFIEQGFDVAWAIDMNRKAIITYTHNLVKHNDSDLKIGCADIAKIDAITDKLEPVDIITAGFPCQPFSIAGQQLGLNHHQGNVFFEIARIIEQLQPKAILLENVKNIVSHENGRTISIILNQLKKLGYSFIHQVMNTSVYTGIPQNRERWYLVGFKDPTDAFMFQFPNPINRPMQSIKSLLECNLSDEHYYNSDYLHYQTLSEQIDKKYVVYHWRRSYLRENKSNRCPTLTANMGKGGGNVPILKDDKGIRKFTIRECLRLQGFPEWFSFPDSVPISARYTQIGNSVTVPMVSLIARNMLEVMSNG